MCWHRRLWIKRVEASKSERVPSRRQDERGKRRADDVCRDRLDFDSSGAAPGMRSPVLTEAKKEQKKSKEDRSRLEASARLRHHLTVKVR